MNWKRDLNKIVTVCCLSLLFACHPQTTTVSEDAPPLVSHDSIASIALPEKEIVWKTAHGNVSLTDIQLLDSTLLIDIRYATTNNFTQKVLYKEIKKAYLQPDIAERLVQAHAMLKSHHPDFRFLVYDAVRPLSVQKEMYEVVKETPYHAYVATPEKTSLHNYAAAVDITIVDQEGVPLDMGTEFDFFGKAAGPAYEEELLKQGTLTQQQIENRSLLRETLRKAGFRSIRGEWWHFNACSLSEAKEKYTLIE